MRKTLTALLAVLALAAAAKGKRDDTRYLAGAVPEESGVVTFRKTFRVSGRTDDQIYDRLSRYVREQLAAKAIEGERTRLTSEDKAGGSLAARLEEYMVFKNIPFALDRARVRYQLTAEVRDGKVSMAVSQISYYYNEDMEGNGGTVYKAEEWITDKAALNKAGTKLYPRSGKFRRKTVDRAAAIFEGAMDAFDQSAETPSPQPAKKERKGVTEDI